MAGANEARSMDDFLRGLWKENPVFVIQLGMCPTLAVSNSVKNGIAMGLAATFVLVMSNLLVSMLRNFIPKQVRIASYIVIIATFVTIVDYVIQVISLELYASLGAFIQLIVVNCIILGRAEAFASRNGVVCSVMDGLGMGLGFTLALTCLASVREVLGAGTFLGVHIMGSNFEPWGIMILPPGGFFVLAGWLLMFNWWRRRQAAGVLAHEQ